MISTVTPARVARSGRAGPPPFPQGAEQRNKGEHGRPHLPTGRARPGSDDGTYTQVPEALFSLLGRIVPPNMPQGEETRRPTNSPRPKAEGTARRAAMKCQIR